MFCPICEESDKQYYHTSTPATPEAPAEAAHYECTYCGHCYNGDPGDEIDAAYEFFRNG